METSCESRRRRPKRPVVLVSIVLLANAFPVRSFLTPRSFTGTTLSSRLRVTSLSTIDEKNDFNKDSSTTQESSSSPTAERSEVSETFDWFKAWYPLVPVEILDKEKPHRFHLLGQDVVVWYDGAIEGGRFGSKSQRPKGAKRSDQGTWRAFVDECPHRKVPLSEGRVEDDGTLLCSYHAWRFDGQGQCVAVPQVESMDTLSRIKTNPKTKCNSFPTKLINGVLFVWPSSDDNAVLESALTPVAHRPAETDKERLFEGPWNFRELPYGADFFIENVVDTAHVAVSHHNIIGNRYMDLSMTMKKSQALSKDGFAVSTRQSTGGGLPATITFAAPSVVTIDAPFGENGARQTLELYVSPSRPGFCNHVGRMVILKASDGKMPALLRSFTLPMPKWLNHLLASLFLNQDALFLHHQERALARTGQYTSALNGENPYHYTKAIYPTNSDLGVIFFRNWLRRLAGGAIPYKYNPAMPAPSNEVVFDVWNAHTKYCKYCQDALRRLKKIRLATFVAAMCVGVIRPAKLRVVGNLAVTLLLAGTGMLLNKLIAMFYRYEFSHAHND